MIASTLRGWPERTDCRPTWHPQPGCGGTPAECNLPELHLLSPYIEQVPLARRRACGFRIGDPVRGGITC